MRLARRRRKERSGRSPRRDHKKSQVAATDGPSRQADAEAGFQPKPEHFRLLEAYEDAFQDGINPTDAVIAKRLNVRRETICRWRRRNPALRAWLYEKIGVRASELKPLVDRRVTQLAISGSPDHMKLFYQFVAKVGHPFDDVPVDVPSNAGAIINILCPRPEIYASAFNEVPNGGPSPGPVKPAALPPASAPSGGHKAYGIPFPATIPVVPVKVPR